MGNKLKDLFDPPVEKRIEDMEKLLILHETMRGHCCTCVWYCPTDMPGFVTDYGYCTMNNPIFIDKQINSKLLPCTEYVEDKESRKKIEEELRQLKEEVF